VEYGLLWYDDSPNRPLVEKVTRAAAQYERKFGQAPSVCFVNPAMLNGNGKETEAGSVHIETLRTVLPYHFLVGIEDVERNGRRKK
jgi:hypothetical protein